MKSLLFILIGLISIIKAHSQTGNELPFHKWALTPPMGWNSWDCFGPSVVENEVKANADYMAENLLEYGWEYIVVDIRWYVDNQTTGTYNSFANSTFIYDEYGRYMPSPTRFPSSTGGVGFKPLADYVHSLGLKFGIHIMRGVPKVAVSNNLPIKGTSLTAADIYSTASACTWLQDNYTIDATKEGAQEYYNSILDLYASWGVDYIKVDDLSRPYHDDEIELIRNAIDQTGRPIVLSMSPGATPLDQAEHAKNNANLWRTVDDFWDNWSQLNYQFGVCANWAPYISPGAWPDADMLPMGHIAIRGERGVDRMTNFTKDEQYTLMTLWSIFKSPLMFGGHLPDNDSLTNVLITNDEVLEMHKISVNNNEWFNEDGMIGWTAIDPTNSDNFVALFNNGGDGFVDTRDLLYRSGTISELTDGYGVDIDISIPTGSTQLFLVVNDGGDGNSYDHADWIAPTIYFENGDSTILSDQDWEYGTAGWGTIQKDLSISGATLNINGTTYAKGIGTHSRSAVLYSIPDSTVRFKSFAGLDIGGTSQDGETTVEFMISVVDPTLREVNINNAIANSGRISRTIQSEGVNLTADITGATKLYLVVTDAGDNFNYDHGDWINPAIYNAGGDSVLLTSLTWVSATSGWDVVKVNTSLDNNTLTVNGTTYTNGFGVNSYSTIEYDLPAGFTTFKAFCGYDAEVQSASNGVTMEFLVFTEDPSNLDSTEITVDLEELGFTGNYNVRDMWAKTDLGTFSDSAFAASIPNHGAGLYRLSATGRTSNVEINLTESSPDTIYLYDTVTLNASLNITDSDTILLTGWVQIYQNDFLITNIPIDSSGNIQYRTVCSTAGSKTFLANYGGNKHYAPVQSNSVTVMVIDTLTSLENEIVLKSQITVVTMNGNKYLKGLLPGDKVSVYNMSGQKISTFIARYDIEVLHLKGAVIIEVNSKSYNQKLKTIL